MSGSQEKLEKKSVCGFFFLPSVEVLVDDTRWYLPCGGIPVPEEVTGAELICFHLILPDSSEMRLHFPVCVCMCVCSSNSRGGEAMERGFPGQAIRLWQRLTGASPLKRSN